MSHQLQQGHSGVNAPLRAQQVWDISQEDRPATTHAHNMTLPPHSASILVDLLCCVDSPGK
jgi:hypothetical protein